MGERTITISGASKTFSVTGWRIGTIVAPPDATDAIRKVHDFLTVGAPAPLQEAVAVGLETLGDDYYERLAHEYRARRDLLCRALVDAGFRCTPPQGAYYVLADCSGVSELPDDEFSYWLTKEIGVAPVPGSSFFSRPELGRRLVRFAFCKTEEQLREAGERLRAVRGEPERTVEVLYHLPPPRRRLRCRARADRCGRGRAPARAGRAGTATARAARPRSAAGARVSGRCDARCAPGP